MADEPYMIPYPQPQPQPQPQPPYPLPMQPQQLVPLAAPALDKKALQRDLFVTCMALAAFIFSMNALGVIVAVIAVLFDPVVLQLTTDALQQGGSAYSNLVGDPVYLEAMTKATSNALPVASLAGIVLSLPWLLFVRGKKLFTTDITAVRERINIPVLIQLFVLFLGIQFAMVVLQVVFMPVVEQAGGSLTDVMEEGMSVLFSSPIGLLYAVLIGPIAEEIVFRGAVMRKLERFGANFAIVVSSLLFGLYHMILFQAVFAVFIGLLLAYTAGRFSLKWSILLHILNNGMAVGLTLIGVPELAISGFFLAGFIASIIILIANRKKIALQRKAGAPVVAAPFRAAFRTPMFVFLVVVLLVIGVLTIGLL
ncbi:MAG: CPBP family intramembrane metalloprotease [Coriobacteriales bacterium]|nr:CPBP family intramembrane metalloprotease [Coriobacteriales bacterium]